MKESLHFRPDFIRKLDALALVARRAGHGASVGLRRTPSLGLSAEFAETRNYTVGDDFRRIDWNAYARQEKLFTRLFHAEKTLNISLLIDTSKSMGWGDPSKLDFARKLAGSLAYLSLTNNDQVSVAGISDKIHSYLPAKTGKRTIWRIWDFLEHLVPEGTTDLVYSLGEMGRYRLRPGLSILLTDLLSPTGYQSGLKSLLKLGQEVILLQVLASEEVEPELTGDWRLLDDEDSTPIDLTASPIVLDDYKKRLAGFVEQAMNFCYSRNILFLQLRSDMPLEDTVLRLLRKARVVT